jgi:flagellar biosynthesis/type III secretory pathway protein FliH
MKLYNLKRTFLVSALSLVAIVGMSEVSNAQGRWGQNQDKRTIKQQQKVIKQQQKYARQQQRAQNDRYRVYRNGQYYNTDNRGAELLRQAVRNGYEQGVRAGQADRRGRRGGQWNNNSMYRSGNYGYQSYVNSSQYQYYFRQGFERGYQDGYNSRQQYGSSNNNGAFNILGTILSGILNIQQY